VRALWDPHREGALSKFPPAAEAGLPGLVSTAWFALAAPPKTPPALVSAVAKAAIEAIKTPEVQARFRAANVEPIGNSPAEALAFIRDETERWGAVIRKNNIVVD